MIKKQNMIPPNQSNILSRFFSSVLLITFSSYVLAFPGINSASTVHPFNNHRTALPDGKVYSFEYDALHRMTARHTPLGTISFDYDGRGNLLTKTLPTEIGTYTYDVHNNLLSSSNSTATWDYTYDEVDRLTRAELSIGGRHYALDYAYQLARLDYFESPAGWVSYGYVLRAKF
jgi:YD repeat-containing protein